MSTNKEGNLLKTIAKINILAFIILILRLIYRFSLIVDTQSGEGLGQMDLFLLIIRSITYLFFLALTGGIVTLISIYILPKVIKDEKRLSWLVFLLASFVAILYIILQFKKNL